jgi:lipopolysaccharide/colanic/teichoic acid biosynthesis glycosyltransferase
MVLIGPRPEQPGFVALYEESLPFYSFRHLIKPGVTGWAQVKYKYADTPEAAKRKLGYDLYYMRHSSSRLDMEIFLRTLILLFRGSR